MLMGPFAGLAPIKLVLAKMGLDPLMLITIFVGGLLALNLLILTIDHLVKKSKLDTPNSLEVNGGTVILFLMLVIFIAILILRKFWAR